MNGNTAERLGLPNWMNWLFGHGFWWYVLVGVLFIYGMMFGLRFFLEAAPSRWLPLWDKQYKTFFPGDLVALIPFLAAVLTLASTTLSRQSGWWQNPVWHLCAFVFAGAVAIVLFNFQISPEETEAGLKGAPTRVWHQLIIWWLGLFLGVSLGVPVLFALDGWTVLRWVVLAGAMVWAALLVYDFFHAIPFEEWNPERPIHAPPIWRK